MTERDDIMWEYDRAAKPYYHFSVDPEGNMTQHVPILTTPDGKWRYDYEKRKFVPNQDRPIMSYEEAMAAPDPELERLIAEEEELEAHLARAKVHPPVEPNRVQDNVDALIRTFDTGASRDTEEGKLDYEGFLSPLVLERYAQYMHKNRVQSDGSLRSADNWQKGIPTDVYMKSMWRHFMDVWTKHRDMEDWDPIAEDVAEAWASAFEESLCAVLFNAMGYLHELLKEQ